MPLCLLPSKNKWAEIHSHKQSKQTKGTDWATVILILGDQDSTTVQQKPMKLFVT